MGDCKVVPLHPFRSAYSLNLLPKQATRPGARLTPTCCNTMALASSSAVDRAGRCYRVLMAGAARGVAPVWADRARDGRLSWGSAGVAELHGLGSQAAQRGCRAAGRGLPSRPAWLPSREVSAAGPLAVPPRAAAHFACPVDHPRTVVRRRCVRSMRKWQRGMRRRRRAARLRCPARHRSPGGLLLPSCTPGQVLRPINVSVVQLGNRGAGPRTHCARSCGITPLGAWPPPRSAPPGCPDPYGTAVCRPHPRGAAGTPSDRAFRLRTDRVHAAQTVHSLLRACRRSVAGRDLRCAGRGSVTCRAAGRSTCPGQGPLQRARHFAHWAPATSHTLARHYFAHWPPLRATGPPLSHSVRRWCAVAGGVQPPVRGSYHAPNGAGGGRAVRPSRALVSTSRPRSTAGLDAEGRPAAR